MKKSSLKKDLAIGIDFAEKIKRELSNDDLKIARCIMGKDDKNIVAVLNFVGAFPHRMNKAVKVGIWLGIK